MFARLVRPTRQYARFAPTARLAPWRRPASTTAAASAVDDQHSNDPGQPGSSFDADNVLRVLHRVQQILGHSFRFPRIVMVGDQPVHFLQKACFQLYAWRWTGFS